ncbi:MAG: AraC family transcriptional regulator [Alphaproteobacteria bacterium]|nr:AraC family transcriptional regulator [Alphaproteobacteria bacterium]
MELRFSIPEILSLLGLVQCVYVLVHIGLQTINWRQAIWPSLFFLCAGGAFFLDFANGYLSRFLPFYFVGQWAGWFFLPPLSVLLMTQIAQVNRLPSIHQLWILGLVPLAFFMALMGASTDTACRFPSDCPLLWDWLVVTGIAAGSISLATLSSQLHLWRALNRKKGGKERYWLILVLLFTNLFYLFFMLVSVSPIMAADQALVVRTILGLAFVYLVGTSLFRVYPQALEIRPQSARTTSSLLSGEDLFLANRIDQMLVREKIYHEPSYSRSDLARELEVPESRLSKVINLHYGKTFPQLLNERRVSDSCYFLEHTETSIKKIALECGFNSIGSFNRVFRQIMHESPGEYRNRLKENEKQ